MHIFFSLDRYFLILFSETVISYIRIDCFEILNLRTMTRNLFEIFFFKEFLINFEAFSRYYIRHIHLYCFSICVQMKKNICIHQWFWGCFRSDQNDFTPMNNISHFLSRTDEHKEFDKLQWISYQFVYFHPSIVEKHSLQFFGLNLRKLYFLLPEKYFQAHRRQIINNNIH